MTMYDAARELHEAGLCVVPARGDGSKRPDLAEWRSYTAAGGGAARPDLEDLRARLQQAPGVGFITGAASGGVEMLEFEGRAVKRFLLVEAARLMADNGLGELWMRILGGYVEASPSGGIHIHYRVEGGEVRGNTALARDPEGQVLVETRGEGGFTICAPSGGPTHPSGKAWEVLKGTPADIPTITREEYDALWLVLGMLDETPEMEASPAGPHMRGATAHPSYGGARPGDDFALRHTWDELLTERGWTFVRQIGQEKCWRRPGKPAGTGISATTGRGGYDNLYNFSTSADLPVNQPISKLYAYALWHHGGDMKAAVKDLAGQGYGSTATPTLRLVRDEPESAPGTPEPLPETADAPPEPSPVLASLSDDGNARLLAEKYGDRLRHVEGIGWCWWDGLRWHRDAGKAAMEAMVSTIHAIEPGGSQAVARHKVKSLNTGALRAALARAESMPTFALHASQLDARATEINTPEGVVDLVTGELLGPLPEAYHTGSTLVAPKRMPTPRWDQFLADTFGDDTDLVAYVQRLVGYSASGAQRDHILPFLLGAGQNGKSVFTGVVGKLLGDFAIVASPGFLMAGRAAADVELARLHGARLVLCAEVNPRDRFDEQRIKMLTGGDRITGRNLYQKHFTFDATQHLWLMGNHQPSVDAGGDSFWRRLRLIPFNYRVPDDKKVAGLAELLVSEEGAGILQWIVDGAVAYFREGLKDPESVTEATEQYASEEDALGRFVADHCHIATGAASHIRTDTGRVRAAYMEWCHAEGIRPLAPPHFGRELRQRYGVEVTKSHGKRYYTGLALTIGRPEAGWGSDRWDD